MVGIRNFQDTFETGKRSFISAFSICMTAPLMSHFLDYHILYHHNQGEVEQMIYKSLVRIFVEGEKISV